MNEAESKIRINNGLVIVFEGIDGAGKTTQLQLAKESLQRDGYAVESIRNLGGTPIGEALREVMVADYSRPPKTDLYISLAIQEALLTVVDQARQEGKIILMDRSPISMAAYQIYGTGIDKDFAWAYVEQGMQRIKPEAIILYRADVNDAVSRARANTSKPDYFESHPISYFEKVDHGYQDMIDVFSIQVIGASADIKSIHGQTMQIIKRVLP